MATFYRSSRLWVVEFTYDGKPRRWVTALPQQVEDAQAVFAERLRDLYGDRARLIETRWATTDEETQYIEGTLPRNVYCATLRAH